MPDKHHMLKAASASIFNKGEDMQSSSNANTAEIDTEDYFITENKTFFTATSG